MHACVCVCVCLWLCVCDLVALKFVRVTVCNYVWPHTVCVCVYLCVNAHPIVVQQIVKEVQSIVHQIVRIVFTVPTCTPLKCLKLSLCVNAYPIRDR